MSFCILKSGDVQQYGQASAILPDVGPLMLIGQTPPAFFDEDIKAWFDRDAEFCREEPRASRYLLQIMKDRGRLFPNQFVCAIAE